jgi:hypothetical protein
MLFFAISSISRWKDSQGNVSKNQISQRVFVRLRLIWLAVVRHVLPTEIVMNLDPSKLLGPSPTRMPHRFRTGTIAFGHEDLVIFIESG